jgi:glycosyltransferase involved in cell wall biosynthesis
VTPDDPVAVAAALRSALEAARDGDLRERLRRASTQLRWTVERDRLLELYGEFADAPR